MKSFVNFLRYQLAAALFHMSMWTVLASHRLNPYLDHRRYANLSEMMKQFRTWSKGQKTDVMGEL